MRMRLLRGLASKLLTCGCLVGVYETYGGTVVKMIDARGPVCACADHRERAILRDSMGVPAGATPPAGTSYTSQART